MLAAITIAIAVVAAGWWLLGLATHAQDPAKARIDAVRAAMTLGAGLVGMVVLWLTGRKQWLAERTQRHNETDATEKRVTELYTAAAQQLASDKAPVRLAGLYALERLGQTNPIHRQTIVNLLCAYLRMPYTPPEPKAESEASSESVTSAEHLAGQSQQDGAAQPLLLDLAPTLAEAAGLSLDAADQQQQEHQVRLTAQRLLAHHLRPDGHDQSISEYWGGQDGTGLDLDLSGAVLYDWDLEHCRVRRADFTNAHFHFIAAFGGAQFHGITSFDGVQFYDITSFGDVHFYGDAIFGGAQFHGDARFGGVQFHEMAIFDDVHFYGDVGFAKAQFHVIIGLFGVQFHGDAVFDEVWIRLDIENALDPFWLPGWTVRVADPGDGQTGRWGLLVSEEDDPANVEAAASPSDEEERANE
ncbi:uncharacterized protein YjbI with pentapeptide repeats [Saccharopolyspora lacisalsi]|uniref:Uncharacterized protein YjbI with pentapeptide repeats n=1 Tax=Halosaccharopolyspora lacisalsi TaxID=1000566 RepID=A0A839DVC9_9PSEU|nr:pentapeptide repeat-containing protein [Halosaccharopolyspora lacisalsi]MBA8825932.1 uncharacterized protein YjbI with pentapeptide repeats [Halosaccharopolyspora lacisalsi]